MNEGNCCRGDSCYKPQFGPRPYWVVIPERIANLCEAIKENEGPDEKMKEWAAELVCLIEMKSALDKRRVDK